MKSLTVFQASLLTSSLISLSDSAILQNNQDLFEKFHDAKKLPSTFMRPNIPSISELVAPDFISNQLQDKVQSGSEKVSNLVDKFKGYISSEQSDLDLESKPESEPKSEPKSESEPKLEAESESKSKAESESKTEAVSEPEIKLKSESEKEEEKKKTDDNSREELEIFEKEPENPACTKDLYEIQSSEEMKNLVTQCNHVSGNINIKKMVDSVIDFGPLTSIGGELSIMNVSNVVRINAPKLNNIGKKFQLKDLTSLSSLSFPNLRSVETIEWRVLPILSSISFDSGIDKVNNILISDTSLVGFSLKDKVIELTNLDLNNNRFLENIDSSIEKVHDTLSIAANSRNLHVSLPALKKIGNISLRDVAKVNLSNVKEITGSAKFYENNFKELKTPKLSSIGGTLSIIENLNLDEAEFSSISEIGGGLMIINNTHIDKIDFFPQLKIIGGAIQFVGDFQETTFDKLQLVKGSALIKSKSSSFDCSKWTDTNNLIIRGGGILCAAGGKQEVLKYDSNDVQGTLTRSKSGEEQESTIKEGAAITVQYNMVLAFISIFIGYIFL